MKPLISVIVPIYNVEKYLRECVDSIIHQTYKNLEIILVDDGSPDNSGSICDEYAMYDKRIKVIHKKNGGLSDARNVGLDNCAGEYISFIDSDDYVSIFFIEILYNAACLNDSDIVTLVKSVPFPAESDARPRLIGSADNCVTKTIEPDKALELMLYQNIPNGAQFRLYKRRIWNKIRFPFGYLFEDVATTYKTFIAAKRMTIVDGNIYAYRVRHDSIVRMKFTEKKMIAIDITQSLYTDICKFKPELEIAAANRCFAQNFHIFLQVPSRDIENLSKLWIEVKKYRLMVIKDTNPMVRRKNRLGAIISLLGMNVAYRIGRLYLQLR